MENGVHRKHWILDGCHGSHRPYIRGVSELRCLIGHLVLCRCKGGRIFAGVDISKQGTGGFHPTNFQTRQLHEYQSIDDTKHRPTRVQQECLARGSGGDAVSISHLLETSGSQRKLASRRTDGI